MVKKLKVTHNIIFETEDLKSCLLNVFNEFGKRDKTRDLSSVLSLFRKELLDNTRARML